MIQDEFTSALQELDNLKTFAATAKEEYEKMKAGSCQIKKLLTAVFVTHADRLLQPGAASLRDKVLKLLESLP